MRTSILLFLWLICFSCKFWGSKPETTNTDKSDSSIPQGLAPLEKVIAEEVIFSDNKRGILKKIFINDTLKSEEFDIIITGSKFTDRLWSKSYEKGRISSAEFRQSDGRFYIGYYKNGGIQGCGYYRENEKFYLGEKQIHWEVDGLWKEYDENQVLLSETFYDFNNDYTKISTYENGELVSVKEYKQTSGESDQIANGKWRYYKLYSGSDSTKQGYYFVTKTETYKNDSLIKTEVHKNGLGEPRVKRHFYKD